MKKLKVLLVLLLAATSGLAVSIYLLAVLYAPGESPLSVLYAILTSGVPQNLIFFIPLSSLLFLSTVLASMVGVIYFLVLPEVKTYYDSDPGKEAGAMVMRTLKPDERKGRRRAQGPRGQLHAEVHHTRDRTLQAEDAQGGRYARGEGIVHVEKRGNTNEVSLAKWFLDGMG